MATGFDDATLSAFLDGRLAEAEAAEVEVAVAREPALAQRLARLRRTDAAARDWFAGTLDDPSAALTATVRRGFRERRAGGRRRLPGWLLPSAAAAAVLVVALVGLDREVDRRVADAIQQMRSERASDLSMLAGAMQEVLETRESGIEVSYRNARTGTRVTLVPRRTWQSESGHWCREFLEIFPGDDPAEAPVSTACRDADGTWRRVRTELRNPDGPPLIGSAGTAL